MVTTTSPFQKAGSRSTESHGLGFRVKGLGLQGFRVLFGDTMVPIITPIMENQMEKKMENDMETGII